MRKFTGGIALGLVGCTMNFEFEVEDDATEDQIEEVAREVAFEKIDWWFNEDEQTCPSPN